MLEYERENFKCFLKNIPHVYITIDFSTSLVNHSYLGITCHYLEKPCLQYMCFRNSGSS
jgi:hypothetical protein